MVNAAYGDPPRGYRAAGDGPCLEDRVERFFAPGGPLAARKPSYAPREGQIGYARAVARAIDEVPTIRAGRPAAGAEDRNPDRAAPPSLLLADCPTGTGKTLASLVPVALAGVPTIYSTATINLQRQLLNSELPLLARSLGSAGAAADGAPDFSYALLKGRANYLCDNRLDALFHAPPSLDGMGAGISPEELRDL
ncbi:MAG: hypothetical protein M3R38_02610, partial [Actinomycetota bacterium]|nr:hypothetical protein [Actinomycetota bacterium]